MEQTKHNSAAKVLIVAVCTFILTFAMAFAILPATTLTAYAADEVSEYISLVASDSDHLKTISGTHYSVSCGYMNASESGMQVCKAGALTINARKGETITKVVLTYSWGNNKSSLSASAGTFDGNATISDINAQQVTISSSNTAGVKISAVRVYFEGDLNNPTVTLTGGANAKSSGGLLTQSYLPGAMDTVTYTALTGASFPEFETYTQNGVTVERTSDTVVTISGTPTTNTEITVPDAESSNKIVTWGSSVINSIYGNYTDTTNGITLTQTGDGDFSYGDIMSYGSLALNFTTTTGKFTSIEIEASQIYDGGNWTKDGNTLKWNGTPSNSVSLSSSGYLYLEGVSSINFVIEMPADLSTATVTLGEDNTVSKVTVGGKEITDFSEFDITYGTDDSHTATTPPTEDGTYYAYVAAKTTSDNYTGTARSNEFTVSTIDKTSLNTAISDAETLYNNIKDNDDYTDIANTLKTAIDNAKAVADSDEVDQDAVDTATANITTAKTTAEAGKKDVDDTKAANAVKEKIAAIGTVEYTTESKGKIDEAREAYDALTADQKALVDTYETLTTAESNYNTLKADNDAADEVKALIAAIGEVAYTTESKDKIDEARAAYNGLTAEQKALVDNYATLTTAETTYATEKKTADDNAAANAVKEKITAIGTVEYTTESKGKIDEAREAYDALTADQKALVDNYATLTTAESTYNTLKANNEAADEVKALIDSIGTVELTVNSKAVIDLARETYDGLTTDQKALVSNYDVLTAAEVRYADLGAADEVKTLVDAIGDVTYSTESKDKIDAAREAYDALTADQKALVTNYGTLTSAEGSYTDLKAVKEAEDAVSVLPASDDITVTDKAAVAAAKAKYDALTPAQKATVSAETVAKLSAASNMVAAQEVVVSIGNIDADNPDSAKVTEARAAYDALTDEQKAKVTNYESLTAAESKLIEINNPEKKGLSGGAIAGIVIAFVVVLGALGALLFSYFKQKKAEKK